jgi:hypothetical protein
LRPVTNRNEKNSRLMLSASMLRPQSAGRSEINIHVSHDFGPSTGFSSNPTAENLYAQPSMNGAVGFKRFLATQPVLTGFHSFTQPWGFSPRRRFTLYTRLAPHASLPVIQANQASAFAVNIYPGLSSPSTLQKQLS